MMQRRIASFLLVFSLCSTASAQDAPTGNVAPTPAGNAPPPASAAFTPVPAGPLGEMDQLFIDTYTARRDAVLAGAQPYIVVSGSSLISPKGETFRLREADRRFLSRSQR